MSRSFKKTPIQGHSCARSEKQDKRIANRRMRANIKTALASSFDPEADVLPALREVTNVYDMSKDGKSYFGIPEDWYYFSYFYGPKSREEISECIKKCMRK